MKILVTGNMGYLGPTVVSHLRHTYPNAEIIGFDIGYFAACTMSMSYLPEVILDRQVFGDIRSFPENLLDGVDVVVNLAAISNDPMSFKFEDVTLDINYRSCLKLAQMAKEKGVKSFVFASSCSVYGLADDNPRKEQDELNPLTAYARSKVLSEVGLEKLADEEFVVSCLRFATACGWTDRLRLDLVLNDFVAGAIVNKEIKILSDGTPWRPLINTKDMARAIAWAISRPSKNGGNFLTMNTGSDAWVVQIKALAEAVKEVIPETSVSVNENAEPDKRSYTVDFSLFKALAPNHQPIEDLKSTVKEISGKLQEINFCDQNYRNSKLIRLKMLNYLQESKKLNSDLKWMI